MFSVPVYPDFGDEFCEVAFELELGFEIELFGIGMAGKWRWRWKISCEGSIWMRRRGEPGEERY